MTEITLRQILTDYLKSKGWYQDPKETEWDSDGGWTVPQWKDYWLNQSTGERTRHYVKFTEAVKWQMDLEDDPATWSSFFKERSPS